MATNLNQDAPYERDYYAARDAAQLANQALVGIARGPIDTASATGQQQLADAQVLLSGAEALARQLPAGHWLSNEVVQAVNDARALYDGLAHPAPGTDMEQLAHRAEQHAPEFLHQAPGSEGLAREWLEPGDFRQSAAADPGAIRDGIGQLAAATSIAAGSSVQAYEAQQARNISVAAGNDRSLDPGVAAGVADQREQALVAIAHRNEAVGEMRSMASQLQQRVADLPPSDPLRLAAERQIDAARQVDAVGGHLVADGRQMNAEYRAGEPTVRDATAVRDDLQTLRGIETSSGQTALHYGPASAAPEADQADTHGGNSGVPHGVASGADVSAKPTGDQVAAAAAPGVPDPNLVADPSGRASPAADQVDKPADIFEPKQADKPDPTDVDKPDPKDVDKPDPKDVDKPDPKDVDKPDPKDAGKPEPKDLDKEGTGGFAGTAAAKPDDLESTGGFGGVPPAAAPDQADSVPDDQPV